PSHRHGDAKARGYESAYLPQCEVFRAGHDRCIETFLSCQRWSFAVPVIRKEQSYDGRWTVFIGTQVVISDLNDAQAEALVLSYRRVVLDDKAA
ncbi:hypothetical protein, partial [Methylobacterium frigidaeris]|uniref:hypothetical protein n=1 Tax=Methylobacterium frigidaeris TaxID=2038277 RepID=UPI001A9C46E1